MKHIKYLAAASAIALAAPAVADDVKVGVVVSTTSTYAFVGEPLVNGMKLAAAEISAGDSWGGHNVEIVYQDSRSDKQEAISLITRLAQSENADPDCLFVTTPPEQAANIIIQARQAGLEGDTILACDSGAGSQKLIDAGGSAVEGRLFPASFVASASESSQAFSDAYEAAYGNAPDLWVATGYTMMQTVANAIRNAGDDVNRETLRDAMAATSDLPVVMGQGKLIFDENRIPSMGGIVMQLKDGAWVAPYLSGQNILVDGGLHRASFCFIDILICEMFGT